MKRQIINFLYFVSTWLVLASGFALLVSDIVAGAGIASAFILYYNLQSMHREENMRMWAAENLPEMDLEDDESE